MKKKLFQFSYFKIFIIIFHTKWIGVKCLIISSRCIMTKIYIKKSKFYASPQDSSYVSSLSITYQSDMVDFLLIILLRRKSDQTNRNSIYGDLDHRPNILLKHLELYPIFEMQFVRGINYSSLMSVLWMWKPHDRVVPQFRYLDYWVTGNLGWDNIIEQKRFRICPQIREVNSIRFDGTSPIVLRCVLFSTFLLLFLRLLFALYLCYIYNEMYFKTLTRLLILEQS